jgi:hypothetical protein
MFQSEKQASKGGINPGKKATDEASVQETSQQRRHQSRKHDNRGGISLGNMLTEEAPVQETSQLRRHQSTYLQEMYQSGKYSVMRDVSLSFTVTCKVSVQDFSLLEKTPAGDSPVWETSLRKRFQCWNTA